MWGIHVKVGQLDERRPDSRAKRGDRRRADDGIVGGTILMGPLYR